METNKATSASSFTGEEMEFGEVQWLVRDTPLAAPGHEPGLQLQCLFSTTNSLKVKALLAQSCPTLCDPKDCKLPGSSVHGILQARILEWVAISSSGEIFLIHGIKPMSPVSPALQADSLPAEPIVYINMHQIVL